MALTVLLALFPTVMLLTIFVGPVVDPLGFSFSMLVGNALSVSILQWIVMPLLTRRLAPWLGSGKDVSHFRSIATPTLIMILLILQAFLFRRIKG